MADALRQSIIARAVERCEYCHLPQAGHEEEFSVDHVIARKHGGGDEIDNLAFCCLRCNLYKGTDLTSIDPVSRAVVNLLNPRRDSWQAHFQWRHAELIGVTPSGRATVALLQMNASERVRLRETL